MPGRCIQNGEKRKRTRHDLWQSRIALTLAHISIFSFRRETLQNSEVRRKPKSEKFKFHQQQKINKAGGVQNQNLKLVQITIYIVVGMVWSDCLLYPWKRRYNTSAKPRKIWLSEESRKPLSDDCHHRDRYTGEQCYLRCCDQMPCDDLENEGTTHPRPHGQYWVFPFFLFLGGSALQGSPEKLKHTLKISHENSQHIGSHKNIEKKNFDDRCHQFFSPCILCFFACTCCAWGTVYMSTCSGQWKKTRQRSSMEQNWNLLGSDTIGKDIRVNTMFSTFPHSRLPPHSRCPENTAWLSCWGAFTPKFH